MFVLLVVTFSVFCPFVAAQNNDITFVHLGSQSPSLIDEIMFSIINFFQCFLFLVFMNHLDVGFDGIDPTGKHLFLSDIIQRFCVTS